MINFLPDGISFLKRIDNKPVHLLLNFHGSEITSVKRKAINVSQFHVLQQFQTIVDIWKM